MMRPPGSTNRKTERRPAGQISLKSLIFLVLIFAFLHGLVKVIPLYIKHFYFKDTIQESARTAREKGDDEILTIILARAKELNLPVTEEDVTIERTDNGNLRIKVNYSVEVKFLGGLYRRFNFDYQTETQSEAR